ncbi:MAG: pyridoxal 5'-phosphate synthase glutaminase subunit PdxT [Ktedonobacterales bacterium]|nr:pyridoxal 5'-phosphate synthase glutaminase subunit PdxT [Ktedonobacterales bacterium]
MGPLVKIGVMALQGDFREHLVMVRRLGAEAVPIRLPREMTGLDGLIIPGGESTVIGKLLVENGLVEPVRTAIAAGLPIWGTCAGLILLARATENAMAGQPLLATMDIRVNRNAFGAQRESFITNLAIPAIGPIPFRAVFIRAPLVLETGPMVAVLARLDDGAIVAVRQGQLLGSAFHPEIGDDPRFHQYFLDIVRERSDSPHPSP